MIVYSKGLWEKDDIPQIWLYENSVLDSFVMENRPEESKVIGQLNLPLTTLDKVVRELQLERVDYIKMDIEGAEQQALRAAQATLSAYRPRLASATENSPDDQYHVGQLVHQAWDGYRKTCGPCMPREGNSIRPEVVYFQ